MPINTPLPFKEIPELSEVDKRVLFFNPSICYEAYTKLNIYERINPRRIELAFPARNDGVCACGCGVKLTGRKRRWATKDCIKFSIHVVDIIAGISSMVRYYIDLYNGGEFCFNCGCEAEYKERKDFTFYTLMHVEHIVPVHKGGGACWLNNYQFLCSDCHKEKTNQDRIKLKQCPNEAAPHRTYSGHTSPNQPRYPNARHP